MRDAFGTGSGILHGVRNAGNRTVATGYDDSDSDDAGDLITITCGSR
jgi:hypothetical protein